MQSNKVDLTPKARRALEVEAVTQRKTMKELASELILAHVSPKTLQFIEQSD